MNSYKYIFSQQYLFWVLWNRRLKISKLLLVACITVFQILIFISSSAQAQSTAGFSSLNAAAINSYTTTDLTFDRESQFINEIKIKAICSNNFDPDGNLASNQVGLRGLYSPILSSLTCTKANSFNSNNTVIDIDRNFGEIYSGGSGFVFPYQNNDVLTMIVKASNFVRGSKIMINGYNNESTFISNTLPLSKLSTSYMLITNEFAITANSPILNGRTSKPEKFVVKSSSFSLWKWVALGTVSAILVVTAIHLLKPYSDPNTIADPPGRPWEFD